MCSACDDEPIEAYVPVAPEVVLRAREIESLMSGERVPEIAWDIYFGFAGGSIEWRHFQRIRLAHDEAEKVMPRSAPVLGRRNARVRKMLVCAEIVS
jgi:hypothetical protein